MYACKPSKPSPCVSPKTQPVLSVVPAGEWKPLVEGVRAGKIDYSLTSPKAERLFAGSSGTAAVGQSRSGASDVPSST